MMAANMGRKHGLFYAVLFMCTVLPSMAKVIYTVGESSGWTTNVDYNFWLNGKTFFIGDSLVFNYVKGHTVDEVSGCDYNSCTVGNPIRSHSCGITSIPLTVAGTLYFICGVPGHCNIGMKLAVTVAPKNTTSPPAPTTPPLPPTTPPPSPTKPLPRTTPPPLPTPPLPPTTPPSNGTRSFVPVTPPLPPPCPTAPDYNAYIMPPSCQNTAPNNNTYIYMPPGDYINFSSAGALSPLFAIVFTSLVAVSVFLF